MKKAISQAGWTQESKDSWLVSIRATYKEKLKNTKFEDLGYGKKRERVFEEQDYCCNKCKLGTWLDKQIPLELEHIDGNNKNNIRENLEGLCPNCHAQTLTYKNRNCKTGMLYTDEQIIDALKNNISGYAAMKSLGMNPHGGHYVRFRRIIREQNIILPYTV
jgi:5-methylcytosine-specific restriction endonuclease McrA